MQNNKLKTISNLNPLINRRTLCICFLVRRWSLAQLGHGEILESIQFFNFSSSPFFRSLSLCFFGLFFFSFSDAEWPLYHPLLHALLFPFCIESDRTHKSSHTPTFSRCSSFLVVPIAFLPLLPNGFCSACNATDFVLFFPWVKRTQHMGNGPKYLLHKTCSGEKAKRERESNPKHRLKW